MCSGGNPKRPEDRTLWQSKIELGEKFFQEIVRHPVPLDMNILKALKRSSLGLDLYLWLVYRTFPLKGPDRLTWPMLYRQFGADPAKASSKVTVQKFRKDCLRELKKIKTAWPGPGVPHRAWTPTRKERRTGPVAIHAAGSAAPYRRIESD